jgi:uncharacterized DUF497 family protein
MNIICDTNKNNRNIVARRLSFDRVADFDFKTALYSVDDCYEYAETRIVAIGYLESRLPVLCFVETENGIPVISFSKANSREVKHYES